MVRPKTQKRSPSGTSSPMSSIMNPKYAAVPRELVERSLRRRFWQALQHEDATAALRLYTASRSDWEQILTEEEEALANASTQKHKKVSNIPAFPTKGRSLFGRKLRRGSERLESEQSTTEFTKESTSTSILPSILKPCDFFILDDMLHPIHDAYTEMSHSPPVDDTDSTADSSRRSWFGKSGNQKALDEQFAYSITQPPNNGQSKTTPLHEAARIGSGDFVRFLVGTAGPDCEVNMKNGEGRTPMHNLAGGLTLKESTRVKYQEDVGILVPSEPDDLQHRRRSSSKAKDKPKQSKKKIAKELWNSLQSDRMECAAALLASDASTNSVDIHGRTPMHYAAALGRADLAISFLNTFGTLLTIVDGQSRTPTEWAALHGHKSLAAQLESRALLYFDALDMDLLEEAQQQQQYSGTLSPPFAWFTTFTMERVEKEREFRVRITLDRMRSIIARLSVGQSARDIVDSAATAEQSGSSASSFSLPPDTPSGSPPSGRSSPTPTDHDFSNLARITAGQASDLLVYHQWDVKTTLLKFYENPTLALQQANIQLPNKTKNNTDSNGPNRREICMICCDEFDCSNEKEWRDLDTCNHGFCVECLGDYIGECANDRHSGFVIPCPHHECSIKMATSQVADLIPSKKVKKDLTEAATSNFVVQAKDFRFCPLPGCQNVVKFVAPKNKSADLCDILSLSGAVCCSPESHSKRKEGSTFITYEGIFSEDYYNCQSGTEAVRAHRFCFRCGEAPHWPISCQLLEQWKDTVREHIDEVGGEEDEGQTYEEVSHKLWLKANTRPCPKCNAPIQKDEGCNHMTCSNPLCKHEFCWICRKDWSLHGTDTGGFFRCNRWLDQGDDHEFYEKAPRAEDLVIPTDEDLSDPRRMRAVYGTAMHETRAAKKRAKETQRFIHHYSRFAAHAGSSILEAKMFDTCAHRLKPVIKAAIEFNEDLSFNFGDKGLSFVFDAFFELKECRLVLQHSYAFAYFRYKGKKRHLRKRLAEGLALEQMQSELEMLTEQMSDLVARKHIRATQSQIINLTLYAAQKRRDFSGFMMRVLAKEKKESHQAEERNSQSLSQGGTTVQSLGETTSITGIAGESTARPVREMATDPIQISLQHLQEATGNSLNAMLNANTSYESGSNEEDEEEENEERTPPTESWACTACTFINATGLICEMCATARPN